MVFVFRFGYETPQHAAANTRHGWDDEDSQYVLIDAPDEASALNWGRDVAERFVREMGGGSWRAGKFAHWIEPLSDCPWAIGRPVIAIGQFPTTSDWVQR
jgi:hypothetical protein